MSDILVRISQYVNLFFMLSFLGWVMECIVIRQEKGVFENRGFVHGPFCIIYGFGVIIGSTLLRPIADHYLLLFLIGAVGATFFEFFVGKTMMRVLGKVWWDYNNKPFNYRGIICLESTIGWGIAALLVVPLLYSRAMTVIEHVPPRIGVIASCVLIVYYAVDFTICWVSAHGYKFDKGETEMILGSFTNRGEIALPDDAVYLGIIKDILFNKQVQSMKDYTQHGNTSCLQHSINVSYLTYAYCRNHGYDAVAAARAGMLHDMFLYDWHERSAEDGGKSRSFHGFTHPKAALNNAQKVFTLSSKERSMIVHHMWPLTIVPPRYKEAYVLSIYDKYCSIRELLNRKQPMVVEDYINIDVTAENFADDYAQAEKSSDSTVMMQNTDIPKF